MDYEKKYKEALEVMRQWIAPCHTKKQLDVMKESVFPELRESEDERIRKAIVHLLEVRSEAYLVEATGFKKEQFLSYLEKQKEQKPISFYEPYNPDEYEVIMEGNATSLKRKKQKPIDDGTREKIISRATSEKQIVLVSESDGNAEIGWDTRSLEDAKKLLEYGLAFINKNGINPAEKQDYSGLTDLERAIHRGFLVVGVENVPVTIIKDTAQDCLAHMPAEWSEEDEKMRYFVTEAVQSRYSDRELSKYINPGIIKEKKQLKQRLFDWLRDLRPSWKPSKQQMEALHEAVIRSCSHHYGVELSNLEIDLLKLK